MFPLWSDFGQANWNPPTGGEELPIDLNYEVGPPGIFSLPPFIFLSLTPPDVGARALLAKHGNGVAPCVTPGRRRLLCSRAVRDQLPLDRLAESFKGECPKLQLPSRFLPRTRLLDFLVFNGILRISIYPNVYQHTSMSDNAQQSNGSGTGREIAPSGYTGGTAGSGGPGAVSGQNAPNEGNPQGTQSAGNTQNRASAGSSGPGAGAQGGTPPGLNQGLPAAAQSALADCELIVKEYRRQRISKAKALHEIYQKLTGAGRWTTLISSTTVLRIVDVAAGPRRAKATLLRVALEAQSPWAVTEFIESSIQPLSPSLTETLRILKVLLQDPKIAKRSILTSANAPEFPDAEWTNLVNGRSVNLDAPSVGVWVSDADTWTIAYDHLRAATLFVFPRRARELDGYKRYIVGLFAAMHSSFHDRVISFDKAVRKRVASRRNVELTDFSEFLDIKVAVIDADTDGVVGAQRESSSALLASPSQKLATIGTQGAARPVLALAGACTSAMSARWPATRVRTVPAVRRTERTVSIGACAGGFVGLQFLLRSPLPLFFVAGFLVAGRRRMIEISPTSRQPHRLPWTLDRLVHQRAIALGLSLDPNSNTTYTSATNSYLTFVKMHGFPPYRPYRGNYCSNPTKCSGDG
ncbi:hypothetical protein B0H13DRAFT_2581610 [Mycena leptocephala]|nr:hypothetical protein B0H13DRAFT_2581610 [Mycena leptocephala]